MNSSVIFVCSGNICRSPTAEGVFRKMVDNARLSGRIVVDSAGTQGYHVGEPPDQRTVQVAARRGYDLSALRARRFLPEDFERFDLVLAMDRDNHSILSNLAGAAERVKLRLMTHYARRYREFDVPDPYYGGKDGFERVLDMIEDAAKGLLDDLRDAVDDGGRVTTLPPR